MPNQVDLDVLVANGGTLSISNEPPEEAGHRRQMQLDDAAHARRINLIVIGFALFFVALVLAGCFYIFAKGPEADKKWAAGFIGLILSGLVGYIVGKKG